MRLYSGSTTARPMLGAAAVLLTAWFISVPAVLDTSTFLALGGVLAAFGWVVRTTFDNAQPATSLAHTLHAADRIAAPARSTRRP